jgi:hypothetical protein
VRTTLLATAAVALAMPLMPDGAAARTHRPTCFPPHTKTIAADAKVRVFQTRKLSGHAHVTYGCLLKRKRPVKFFLPDFPTGYGPIVLAAPFVAYGAYGDCAAAFCNPNSVVLQNLRGGSGTPMQQQVSVANVDSLVLKPNGSLAFIASTFDQNGAILPGLSVVKVEQGAKPVVLDSGAGVDAGSLALAGSTLYWTDAGAPMSAPLS